MSTAFHLLLMLLIWFFMAYVISSESSVLTYSVNEDVKVGHVVGSVIVDADFDNKYPDGIPSVLR